jgi:hypothetical protein
VDNVAGNAAKIRRVDAAAAELSVIPVDGPLRQFVIPADTVNKMLHHMFLHVVCNYHPDATVGDHHLREVFDCIGIKLFSVDSFRKTMMPKEVAKQAVDAVLRGGWRPRRPCL